MECEDRTYLSNSNNFSDEDLDESNNSPKPSPKKDEPFTEPLGTPINHGVASVKIQSKDSTAVPTIPIRNGRSKLIVVNNYIPTLEYTGGANCDGSLFDKAIHGPESDISDCILAYYGSNCWVVDNKSNYYYWDMYKKLWLARKGTKNLGQLM